jgi:hypothetical protein
MDAIGELPLSPEVTSMISATAAPMTAQRNGEIPPVEEVLRHSD